MGYQAPMVLLVAVISLSLAYGCLWWRQKHMVTGYPCLVLLVSDQEEFLEGLLRRFLWWCSWHGAPWQLQVCAGAGAGATLAILRHFFYPYPCNFFRLEPAAVTAPVVIFDLRREAGLDSAWANLSRICRKN